MTRRAGAYSPATAAPTASRRLPAWPRCGCTWASPAACSSRSTTAPSRLGRNSSPAMWRASRPAPTAYCGAIRAPRRRTARKRGTALRRTAERGTPLGKIIEPLRGVHDVLPAQAPAWQYLEADHARSLRGLWVRGISRTHHRADAVVQALHRRFHRHRRKGNVQLHRSGRGSHHAAARSDRRHRARGDLERITARGPAASLVHGSDVQTRTAAGGTLPAVPSNRCRGVWFRGARRRCGNDSVGCAAVAAARIDRASNC